MKKNKRIFIQKKTHAYILPGPYGVGMTYAYSMTPVFRGKNFGTTIILMKDGVLYWYALEHKLEEAMNRAFSLTQKDPDYVFKIRKRFEKIVLDFTNFTTEVFHKDLTKLSNHQLCQIMEKYFMLYPKIYAWGEPITLGLEDSLGGYLKEYLKGKMNNYQDLKLLTETYNILISPKEKSFVRREADDLLKIVQKIQQNKKIKQFFIKEKVTPKEIAQRFSKIYAEIKKHEAAYCWVPYDYGVYLWDLKYFLKITKDLVKSRNAEQDLEKSRHYYQILIKKQQQLIKKLKIETYYQKLFKVLRTCAFLLDYKKEQFTKSHYQIISVLREIAKRFKITEVQVRIYTPNELKQSLLYNKMISQKKLKSRYKYSVLYWAKGRFKLYEGGVAKTFFNQQVREEKWDKPSSLDGVIASVGKCVGRVRVILYPRDLKKFRTGEILVTQMTSPDYITAIRKAGAIVTDKGGVTCHAAIVSREMGIPCVVGTKIATKVFKTGELVEVNANHNSVRIIKK